MTVMALAQKGSCVLSGNQALAIMKWGSRILKSAYTMHYAYFCWAAAEINQILADCVGSR